MYFYAITLRKVELPALLCHYREEQYRLSTKYPRAEFSWHFEDTHGLHCHGMIRTPTRMYINRIHPGHGWNVDFHQTRSRAAWQCYILKDSALEHAVLARARREEEDFFTPPDDSEIDEELIDNSDLMLRLKSQRIV